MLKMVVEQIVKQLVEAPDEVTASFTESEGRLSVKVFVNQNDLKRVIGREGRVVRALQSFIAAFEPNRQVDVTVDVAS